MRFTLTLQESHYEVLFNHLIRIDGNEHVAFIICGRSLVDGEEDRFLSREVIILDDNDLVASLPSQVCWDNKHFVKVLKRAESKGFAVIAIHNHPSGFDRFSHTDDKGEFHLFTLAFNRNGGSRPHASVVMLPDGSVFGRVWKNDLSTEPLSLIRVVGKTLRFWYPERLLNYESPESFQRQKLAFGNALVQDLSHLVCTVVGAGATGSATAMLLARLGIGTINLIDKDYVEESNLNRLYGATFNDIGNSKVLVLKKHIEDIGLGTKVHVAPDWVSSIAGVDLLKSSDVIFGCTDDHAGRIVINRFAYFYLIPTIDMGLVISVGNDHSRIENLQGRLSYLYPGSDCLITKEVINPDIAYAENLRRSDVKSYEKLKKEAYVVGEGNPAPSVVTFTTQVASMAVNELLNRMQKFNPDDLVPHKIHFFHRGITIRPQNIKDNDCRICGSKTYWGRGDMEPFLDMVL